MRRLVWDYEVTESIKGPQRPQNYRFSVILPAFFFRPAISAGIQATAARREEHS